MIFAILKVGLLSGLAFVASLYLARFGMGGIGQISFSTFFPAFANFGGSIPVGGGVTWPAWNGAGAISNVTALSSSLTQGIAGLGNSLNLDAGTNQGVGIAVGSLFGFSLGKAGRHA